jgi:hypothetical protein
MNADGELSEEDHVLSDPTPSHSPIADGLGVPGSPEMLQVLEHADTRRPPAAFGVVEMAMRRELARTKEGRNMSVVDPAGQAFHCSF